MKTIITIGFLITVSLFSELTMAVGNFKVNVALKSEGNALTEISNNSEQKHEISISNMEGDVLYISEVQGEKVASNRIFDFSESAFGVYKVKVKFDGESNEQLVTVTSKGAQVGEILRKTEPVFTFNDNLLKLSYLNQTREGMTINVYSEDRLIWEKDFDNSALFNRKFDLSKLDKGDYQVILSSGEEIYEYQLTR